MKVIAKSFVIWEVCYAMLMNETNPIHALIKSELFILAHPASPDYPNCHFQLTYRLQISHHRP